VSYLKDLPCASCGTESTYYFPDKPTAHYCYCSFRYEIGEQIAREFENLDELKYPRLIPFKDMRTFGAAIVRGEK